MVTLRGRLLTTEGDEPVTGYAVSVVLTFVVAADGDSTTTFTAPAAGGARSGADGRFVVEIDSDGSPQRHGELSVSAPNGALVHRQELDLELLDGPLEIRLDPAAPFHVEPSDLPGLGDRLRVTGRVIDEAGGKVPAGLPVVLWGVDLVDGEEPPPRPLLVTETRAHGTFGGDRPTDRLARAFGRVAGGPPVPVPLDDDRRIVRRILLVTRLAASEGECECEAAPPRSPDPIDLATDPAAFSQDLGGGCVDLTVPNRSLEEFSYFFVVRTSEPRVKSLRLGGRRTVPNDLLADLLGASLSSATLHGARLSSSTFGNSALALDVASARYLVRGDVAPRPEAIERAAWLSEVADAKAVIGATLTAEPTRHALDADHPVEWDTPTLYPSIEIAHGHILHYKEIWRADGYSLGDLLYSLPLAPGQRRRIAVVDWDRRSRSARTESLEFEEELDALLSRDRDIREIVGSDLHETTSGGSRNTTWGAAGGIGAGFIGSGFGIFGGIAGGASGSSSEAWQRSARRFSADSLQQLRDRVSQRSSAVRSERSTVVQSVAQGETVRAESEVVANYNRCHALTIAYFEVLRHFLITHELADVQECLFVPLPLRRFDRGKALRWREVLGRYLRDGSLARGFAAIERIADQWVGWDFPESRYSEEAPTSLEGELRVSFVLPRPRDAADGAFQIAEWEGYRPVLSFFPRELFNRLLERAVAANKSAAAARDEVFQREIAPEIAANLVNRLRCAYVGTDGGETEVPLDATLVSRYREGTPLYVSLRPAGDLPAVPREEIAYFRIAYDGEPLPPEAQVIVHSGRLRYRTDHIAALLFDDDRLLDDLRGGDPVVVATPTSRRELRNPREEDLQAADHLVAHLNDELEFYHQVLWHSLDAERRYMLLDAIEVPGQDGRSVASLCVNDLVGIVGNSLVLPVAPGQRLDPSVTATDAEGNPVDVRNAYATPPSPPLRVSVPTRGVFAEAVAGECNACEAIDDTRYWRFTTDGLLAPPEIEPIDTGSRASEEPDLTPTPLPSPLVSIQNAPQAPDPFGLASAFGLLARPDLFRDVAGLEGTQKNAIAAFDAALSAASAVGGEAAKLARQNELSRTSERMLDRIGREQADGLLTPEAAKRLTESVLGGLAGREEPTAEAPQNDKTVDKAVDKLAQAESGSLRVETPSETVEVSFDDAAPVVGGGAVPATHPALGAPHDSTDVPFTAELTFGVVDRKRPNRLIDDITPFVLDTRDLLARAFPQTPFERIEATGLLLPGKDAGSYRLRRPLNIVYPAESTASRKLAGEGRLPVVVLEHGAHDPLRSFVHPTDPQKFVKRYVDSYLGFRYLQDALAALGIVSVSVDVNAANLLNSTLMDMRANLAVSALDTLRALDKKGSGSIFEGRLDFSRVGLFGHSRGGDAVILAARKLAGRSDVDVKFVCALAPTDFSGRAKPSQQLALGKADTDFLLVLYGTQDGDVSGRAGAAATAYFGGTGFGHYDRATTEKSMQFLDGCSHNRFNTVWMADTVGVGSGDEFGVHPADVASEEVHRKLLVEYVSALAKWRLLGDASDEALFNGERLNQRGLDESVQWSYGTRVLPIDDMEDPLEPHELLGAGIDAFADTVIGGARLETKTYHRTGVLTFEPSVGGVSPSLLLDLPVGRRDWRKLDFLVLRTTSLFDLTSQATILAGRTPELEVRITDAQGNVDTLDRAENVPATAPAFHRGFFRKLKMLKTTPDGDETVIETTADHGLSTGDEVKIAVHRGHATLDPSRLGINGVHTVTKRSDRELAIGIKTAKDLGTGTIGVIENWSRNRLETAFFTFPSLDLLLAGSSFDTGDVRQLEVRPKPGFAQHVFIDSIELVKL